MITSRRYFSLLAADYGQITEAIRLIAKTLPVKVKPAEARWIQLEHEIVKLRKRFDEVVAIDFFGASGREAASGLISESISPGGYEGSP